MPSVPFTDATTRSVLQTLGDRPSVLNWLATDAKRTEVRTAANTDDLAVAIQDAIDAIAAKGGGELFFPAGTYLTTDISVPAGVVIVGDNRTTIFKRHSSLPAQTGLINLAGVGAGLRNISIDGDVTTTTTITGNEGGFDPDGDTLTANTSIWVAAGANDFFIEGCYITHTGGYAVFVDVRTGNTRGGRIVGNTFENNRPHLWKYDAGDTAYGSWTGGVFIKGICSGASPYAASGIVISGNSFRRQTGNCIWMHSDAFDVKHSDITITGNTGEYVARDFTMVGNVQNISVVGNSVSYVGYVHTTDIDAPAAAYSTSSGIYGVAYDNAGYSTGTQSGNSAKNVYGGGMDLDGVRDSVIASNYISCNASFGKGIQTGDSSANGGATNVVIEGNFLEGCLYGAIVLANASDCTVRGNRIEHSNYATQPILLYAGSTVPSGNVVTQNRITYTLGGAYCVIESGTGWGSSHINYVGGNVIDGGHAGEFAPDASSASKAGIPMFANATNAALLAREGTGTSSSVKIYITEAGTRNQYFQLQSDNALLNISEGGTAQTGILATGTRTTLGYGDALFTGKVMGDAYFAAYDYAGASTSYQASDANALSNDWALLRFNKASTKWETSLTTSAGARVWTDLVPAEISGLTAGRVVFAASATTLDDDALLTWNDTTKILEAPRLWVVGNQAAEITAVIRGAAAQTNNLTEWHNSSGHALAVIGPDGKLTLRDIDSSTGSTVSFYYDGTYTAAVIDKPLLLLSGTATALTVKQDASTYAGIVSGAIQANSTATNAIEVIGAQGGVVADRLLSRVAYYFTKFASATMTAPTAGYGALQYKAGKVFWYYDDSGTPTWREVDFGSVGAGVTSITGTANQVIASASTGAVTLSLPQSIHTGAGPTFATLALSSAATNALLLSSGSVTAVGLIATGSAYNTIQTTTGGLYVGLGVTLDQALYPKTLASTPNNPSAGYGGFSHKATSTYRFWNGSAWFDVDLATAGGVTSLNSLTGALSIVGTSNQITVTPSGSNVTLSTPQNIHPGAGPTFATLTITSAATNAIGVTGSIAAAGYAASSTNTDAIQATSGGVTARFLIGTRSFTLTGDSAANAGVSSAGQGRLYFDSTSNKFQISQHAGAYQDLLTTVAGTSNQVLVNGGTAALSGAVTLTLPQSIHTSATPTFSTLALSSAATNALLLSSGSVTAVGLIATGAAYNTIQTTTGGLYVGLGVTLDQALYPKTLASSPNDPASGYGGFSHKATSTYRFWNGSAWFDVDLATAAGVTSVNTLTGALTLAGTSNQVTITPSGSTLTFSTPQNLHSGATPTFNGLVVTAGTPAYNNLQLTNGGIYTVLGLTTDQALYPKTLASDPNSPSGGYGGFSHKSGATYRYWNGSAWADINMSTAGGGVTQFNTLTGSITLAGTSNQITLTPSGNTITLSTPQNIHTAATPTFGGLTVRGNATIGGVASNDYRLFTESGNGTIRAQLFAYDGLGGYVGTNTNHAFFVRVNDGNVCGWATTGVLTQYYAADFDSTLNVDGAVTCGSTVVATGAIASNSTAYNAIQAVQANTSGIRSYKFTAEMALYLAKYASSASITGGSTTHGAFGHKSGHIYYYWNSTAQTWHEFDFSAVGGGVSSVTGSGAGISVSPTTGAVVVSNTGVTSVSGTTNEIEVSASTGAVTISLPNTTLVQRYNASGDGSNYTFTNSNSTFIVDTSGNLSMSADINVLGVYKMDGTTIINSSGAFIGAGVDVGTYGVAAGGFNPDVGGVQYTGQSWTISISGSQFVISGVGTYNNLIFKGGCITGAS